MHASLALLQAVQAVHTTAGPEAARVDRLGRWMYTVAAIVCAIVILAALFAALRPRAEDAGPLRAPVDDATNRTLVRVVGGSVAVTAIVLLAFLITDFQTGRAMARLGDRPGALVIEVRGHQWWWDVRYLDPDPSKMLSTANEIHIPVGRPVKLRLTGADVVHSFWVPSLQGKRDLIPGRWSVTWLQADSAGIYRGQCAEFCGYEHAKMALFVIADPPAKFNEWYAAQLAPATQPTDSVTRRGGEVFQAAACVMCHAIGGTPAGSHVGPSLTHVGSAMTLAAGSIPNTRGWLAAWITDPQRIKPGTRMPPNQLSPDDLDALLSYLESLK